jgi:hypothetical protein
MPAMSPGGMDAQCVLYGGRTRSTLTGQQHVDDAVSDLFGAGFPADAKPQDRVVQGAERDLHEQRVDRAQLPVALSLADDLDPDLLHRGR